MRQDQPGQSDARCAPATADGDGDTIVLSTADRWGNMVSWVNTNYANFGSGITVPGYGFILHNRGGLFTLDPNSPNVIAPHKRPYNTLAAAFVMQGGRTDGQLMALQLMGGDMQSQGHAQMMVEHGGSGRQPAGRLRHGALPPQSSARHVWIWKPRRSSWWARNSRPWVTRSANGWRRTWAAIRPSCSRPIPKEPKPDGSKNSQQPVNGTYRAGTDHRKDGIAAGW